MDEHFVSKFYKMMEQVSKDVKHNKAQLLQEKVNPFIFHHH